MDARNLEVYQRSKKLFVRLAKATETFPKNAYYLKDQMLRAANSIHANMAEGCGRSTAEFKQYLTRALGSNNEMLSHLEDAYFLKYLPTNTFEELSSRVYDNRKTDLSSS